MIRILRTATLLSMMTIGIGCATTTQNSRELAIDVGDQLDRYIARRRDEIAELNAEYQTTYVALLGEYRDLSADRLKAERRSNARSAADSVLLDWKKKTTFTAITTELGSTRDRQYSAMLERAAIIDKVRTEYAESYSAIKLDLKKLEAARSKLADLSQKEGTRESTLQLLGLVAKAYQANQTSQKETSQ